MKLGPVLAAGGERQHKQTMQLDPRIEIKLKKNNKIEKIKRVWKLLFFLLFTIWPVEHAILRGKSPIMHNS